MSVGGSPRQVSLMASVHTQLHTDAHGRCHQARRGEVRRAVLRTDLPVGVSSGCVYMNGVFVYVIFVD